MKNVAEMDSQFLPWRLDKNEKKVKIDFDWDWVSDPSNKNEEV